MINSIFEDEYIFDGYFNVYNNGKYDRWYGYRQSDRQRCDDAAIEELRLYVIKVTVKHYGT